MTEDAAADASDPGAGVGRARRDPLERRLTHAKLASRGAWVVVVAAVATVVVVALASSPTHYLAWGVVLRGVVFGGLQALIAMGLVLVFRGARIINFSQAVIGTLAASLAVILTAKHLSYFLAVPIGLLFAVGLGWVIDKTVVRRFERAPRLVFTVATIGLQFVLGSANLELPHLFGNLGSVRAFHAPISLHLAIAPFVFNADWIAPMLVVPLVLVALMWFLQGTARGVAIRAAADSPERALLLGIPVRRLSAITWMVAAGLSAIGAMLSAPLKGDEFGTIPAPTTLLIPLAAAVLGRMESLPLTALWSVALSVVQATVSWNYGKAPYADVIVFVLILGGLLLQRRRDGSRQAPITELAGLREVTPIPAALAALREVKVFKVVGLGALLFVVAVVPLWFPQTDLVNPIQFLTYALVTASLVVLTGWAGQISLGQYALVGLGAAVTGALMVHLGLNLILAMGCAGVAGALAALVVGIPALRIPGLYLAVATMAFAVPVSNYLLSSTYVRWLNPDPVSPPLLFKRFYMGSPYALYEFALLVVVGAFALVYNLRRSRPGRSVVAARDNERASAAYGISPLRAKLLAFAVSGALAGLAGGLVVLADRGIQPSGFDPNTSFVVFIAVVIGGLGTLTGALIGAAFVSVALALPQGLGTFVIGAGLLVLLALLPEGLGRLVFALRDQVLVGLARRRGLAGVEPQRETAGADGGRDPGADPPGIAIGSGAMSPRTQNAALRLGALEDLEARGRRTTGARASADAGPPDHRPSLVELDGVDAGLGETQILFDVSLGVAQGEVVALLGTNGAGKSTVLQVIAGLLQPERGTINFVGTDVTRHSASDRVGLGLVTMFSGRGVFDSLTVAENLRMGAWLARQFDQDRAFTLAATQRVLTLFPPLEARLNERAGLLSGGEQQMLSLAQSLLCRPKLLIIDELSFGLAPRVVAELLGVIRSLARSGVTVVVVEQSVNVAAAVSGRAVFMERGRVRFSGPTPDITEQPKLLRSVFLHASKRAERRRAEDPRPAAAARARRPKAASSPSRPAPARRPSPMPTPDEVADLIAGISAATTRPAPGAAEPSSSRSRPSADPSPPGRAQDVDIVAILAGTAVPVPPEPRPPSEGGAPRFARQAGEGPHHEAGEGGTPERAEGPLAALSAERITKRYGGITALQEVTFEVMAGEILGLIGSNGAGKTTLFDVCCGFTRPTSGTIRLFGDDVTAFPPDRRAVRGLGRAFQDSRLWPAMTVGQSITTALERRLSIRDPLAYALGLAYAKDAEADVAERTAQLIAGFGLERFAERFISELSTGTRRVVEIACAVAHEPRVLLLDEPTSGLAQRESEALAELLLGLREQTNAAFVVIEHDVPLVAFVADRLVCLDVGEIIAEGDPPAVLDDPVVVAAYLGADDEELRGVHDRETAGAAGAGPGGSGAAGGLS